MYVIIALSMIVFSVLAVTTRKILRAATFLLFTLSAPQPCISNSTTSSSAQYRLQYMPAV